MPPVHSIRLRGPWELRPFVAASSSSAMLPGGDPLGFAGDAITQQLPAGWDAVLPGFRGTVRYMRRFGKPTNLETHERVWLVVGDVAGVAAAIELNGEKVSDTFFDITDLLRERNLLQIDVTQTDPEQPAGLMGEVRLEIRVGPAVPGTEQTS
jgi:hypothetical protein